MASIFLLKAIFPQIFNSFFFEGEGEKSSILKNCDDLLCTIRQTVTKRDMPITYYRVKNTTFGQE